MKPKKDNPIFTVSYLSGNVEKTVTGTFLMFMSLSESVTVLVIKDKDKHIWVNLDGIIKVVVKNPPEAKGEFKQEIQDYVQWVIPDF